MGVHRPDPNDDLVVVIGRLEMRGSSGAKHLSRYREARDRANGAKPGVVGIGRCGASGWFTGKGEPDAAGKCNSCFRDVPAGEPEAGVA